MKKTNNSMLKIVLILLPMLSKGSEAIVRAMLDNVPSEQVLPLIAAASPEELNRESDIFLPIELACSSRDKKIIEALVEGGADVNRKNRDDEAPLGILIDLYRGPCDLPIIKYMLSKGANPEGYSHSVPGVQTLLDQYRILQEQLAEQAEEEKCCHEYTVLKQGVDSNFTVNDKPPRIWTAVEFYIAAQKSEDRTTSKEIIEQLIDKGCDLGCAIENEEGVQTILSRGVEHWKTKDLRAFINDFSDKISFDMIIHAYQRCLELHHDRMSAEQHANKQLVDEVFKKKMG